MTNDADHGPNRMPTSRRTLGRISWSTFYRENWRNGELYASFSLSTLVLNTRFGQANIPADGDERPCYHCHRLRSIRRTEAQTCAEVTITAHSRTKCGWAWS